MNLINSEEKKKTKVSVGAMLSVLELVIAIGVFAIISTFLLRFFTVANRLSNEASEVSKASISAEAIMEHIKGAGFEETIKEFGMEVFEGVVKAKYDKNFKLTKGDAAYNLEIARSAKEIKTGIIYDYTLKIVKLKNNQILFEMKNKSYEKVVANE